MDRIVNVNVLKRLVRLKILVNAVLASILISIVAHVYFKKIKQIQLIISFIVKIVKVG